MDTDAYAPAHTSTASMSDVAYAEIKAQVLLGTVRVGSRLREERIAERLAVSRTPVREALLRLFAERFLERHPDGGFRVAYPTARYLRELYDVRRALETFAVQRTLASATTASTATLTELHDEWSALQADAPDLDPEFVLLDEDFHSRLAEASENEQLVDDLRRVCERIRPVRTHDFVTPGRIRATIAEHLAIVTAVLTGSPDAAALLDQHILRSQRVVEPALGRVIERMVSTREDGLGW
jgi:DNA-binding GntR family transcriptional regulator